MNLLKRAKGKAGRLSVRKAIHCTVERMESRTMLSTTIAAWSFTGTQGVSAALVSPSAGTPGVSATNFQNAGIPTLTAIGMTASGTTNAMDIASTSGTAHNTFTEFTWRIRGSSSGLNGDANGWWLQAPQYTQGAEIDLNTTGFSSLGALTFDWYCTTSGVKDMMIQYNTDTTNSATWTNLLAAPLVATSNDYFGGASASPTNTVDLSGISLPANDANFGLRLVSAYDPNFSPGAYSAASSPNSGTQTLISNTGGNWRFDNIAVTANAPVPVITTQPSDQTVLAGNTASFTAAATGDTSQKWQSSPDGTTWTDIAGATSTTYSFSATTAQSGLKYRCVFTNASGSVPTNAATLTVQTSIPTITTNPLSQNVIAGATATFTAAASAVPAPTVQWQVSTNGGSTFTNISGATSTTLSLTANENLTGNQYRAVFTNASGTTPTTGATLTVVGTPLAQWIFTGGLAPTAEGLHPSTYQNPGTGSSPFPTYGPLSNIASTLGLQNTYSGVQAFPESDILIERSTLNPSYSEFDWRVRSGNGQGPTGSPGTPEGWSQNAPQFSQGVLFKVNTTGYSNITFQFDWNQGGISDLQPQYSPDGGTTWINAPSGMITAQGNDFFGITNSTTTAVPILVNLQGVAAANNNPNFELRLVTAYEPSLPLITDGNLALNGGNTSIPHGQYASGPAGPVNAQQVIQFGNDENSFDDVTGGTFTLSLDGASTGPINFSSDPTTLAANITTALNALTVNGIANYLQNNFTVSQTNPSGLNPERDGLGVTASDMTVTFNGALAATAVDTMTASSSLTGTNPSISVATWVNGSAHGFKPYVDGSGALLIGNISFNGDSNQPGGLAVVNQPASTSVAGGGTATFTATAYSETVPTTAQWQVSANGGSSWNNISDATNIVGNGSSYSSTLSFVTNPNLTQNGLQYRVVFSCPGGSVSSSAATLTVVAPVAPTFTVQPSNTSVQTGNVTTISATVNKNAAPAPTAQWQVSTDGGTTWTNLADNTTYFGSQISSSSAAGYVSTLTITSAANLDRNQYRVVFSNSAGSAISNAVTLTVLSAELDLTDWDFTNHPTTAPGTFDNSPAPTGGIVDIGTASMVGMTRPFDPNDPATGTDGNGSVDAGDVTNTPGALNPAFNENTWRIRGGPTASTGGTPANGWSNFAPQYTQGVQFSVPTTGYGHIYVTMDWYSTTSGILDAHPQYTVNGTTWINLGPQVQAVSNDFYGATANGGPIPLMFDVSGIAAANNNPNFGVRLVSAYNPLLPQITDIEGHTHGQYANAALVGTPPGPAPYNGSKGNWRFDNIEVHGLIPLPAWLDPNSIAAWDPATHALSVSGNATIIADPGADEPLITADGAAAHLLIQPTNADEFIHVGGLTLGHGATADVKTVSSRSHAHHDVLVLGTVTGAAPIFSVDTINGSKLDLESNDLIIHNGNLAGAQALAAAGRNVAPGGVLDGTWTGNGLTSSAAAAQDANDGIETVQLAVARNGDLPLGQFGDWTVGSQHEALRADGNDIIVKYDYTGDFAMEGFVGGNSATVFGLFFDNGASTDNNWGLGDTNGDGKIDGNDATTFGLLFGNGTGANGPLL